MEGEGVWRGRGYGEGGGMEREVVWRGRGYGGGGGMEGGGMEREGVWRAFATKQELPRQFPKLVYQDLVDSSCTCLLSTHLGGVANERECRRRRGSSSTHMCRQSIPL
jgi:hypothetical protein